MALSDFGGISVNGLAWMLASEGWAGGNGAGDYGGDVTVTKILNRIGWGPGLTDSVCGVLGISTPIPGTTKFTGEEVTQQYAKVCQSHAKIIKGYGCTVESIGQRSFDVLMYLNHGVPNACENTVKAVKNQGKTIAQIIADKNFVVRTDYGKQWSWYDQFMAETKHNAKNAQEMLDDFVGIASGQAPANPGHRYKAYFGEGLSQKLKDYVSKITDGAPLGVYDGGSGSGDGTISGGMVGGVSNIRGVNYGGRSIKEGNPNTVYQLSSTGNREDVLNLSKSRRDEFEKMRQTMVEQTPNRERAIILSSELYNSSILKTTQRSKQDRSSTQIRLKS